MKKNSVVVQFAPKETTLLQVLRMAGCLSLKDWVELAREFGEPVSLAIIEQYVHAGTVQKSVARSGLVMYHWPAGVGAMAEVEDEDELHEMLYQKYGVKSFTVSKASRELSLDRGKLTEMVGNLVIQRRLKEQGIRKFMGHSFQTYKVV